MDARNPQSYGHVLCTVVAICNNLGGSAHTTPLLLKLATCCMQLIHCHIQLHPNSKYHMLSGAVGRLYCTMNTPLLPYRGKKMAAPSHSQVQATIVHAERVFRLALLGENAKLGV